MCCINYLKFHLKFIKLKKFRLQNVFFLLSFYTEHAVRYAVKVSLTNLKDDLNDQLEGRETEGEDEAKWKS